MNLKALFACVALASLTASAFTPAGGPFTNWSSLPKHTFAIGTNDFLLDGQRFQIRCMGRVTRHAFLDVFYPATSTMSAHLHSLEFDGIDARGASASHN